MTWNIFLYAYFPLLHFFFGELPVKVFDLYIFFGEVSIKVFDLFLNLTVFLLLTFKSCLFIFGSSTLSVFFKYLLSGCDLSFSSLDSVFCRAEIFNFRFFPKKYVHVYIYICIFTYVICMWMCVDMFVHACMYMNTYICTLHIEKIVSR